MVQTKNWDYLFGLIADCKNRVSVLNLDSWDYWITLIADCNNQEIE
jgi:hypothetical protein